MRNISNNFRRAIQVGGPFYAYAVITLADNTQLQLDSRDDFFISGNKYDHSFSATFPMGEAACKVLDIGINNTDDRYSAHDFDGAHIVLYTEIGDIDSTYERMQEGVFNVVEAKSTGDIIEISAADNMQKTDVDMPTVSYPATLRQIVNAICTECGLVLGTVNFNNWNYRVTVAPPEMTCREMLGYAAQIAGGNAMIDETGRLVFKSYVQGQYSSSDIISGGNFGDGLSNTISGGVFGDGTSDSINGTELDTQLTYILLSNYTTEPEIATDDIIITGVSYTYKVNKVTRTELYGSEGYVLKLENPLIAGQITLGLRLIGDYIIGMNVRPFSGSFSPNPAIELMDTVYVVDRKGNIYQSFVTSNTFNYLGYSDVANETEPPEQNKAKYKSNASVIYRQVQKDIAEDRTDWENAVEQLNEDLENASGLYETQEVQPDQSIIYYFHDKQTLAESEIVMKITSQALAISTDGGQTYPTGITVDGNAIVSILSSVGINADWITTGTLKVGGSGNTDGQIDIYDAQNNVCGNINNLGISIYDGAHVAVGDSNTNITTLPQTITLKNSTDTKTIFNSTNKLEIYQGAPSQGSAVCRIVVSTDSNVEKGIDVYGDLRVSGAVDMGTLTQCVISPDSDIKYGNNAIGYRTPYSGRVTVGNVTLEIAKGLIMSVQQ